MKRCYRFSKPTKQGSILPCRTTGASSMDGLTTIPTSCSLQLEGIEHRTTKVRRPQSNSFIERLHRTLLDEHFRIKGSYEPMQQMQTDLDSNLKHYKLQHPAAISGQDDGGSDPLQHVQEGSEIDTEGSAH
ncbi:hypothetical protein CJP16_12315 [Aeromonas sobria]|uniref:Integrase catalytic domain-containing protein n=1 Tax=Aeromonas sobria TaxID=646 RepID=A0A2N3IXF5_AERSO|nr:hypothetical protein CJP16_12315 [Aeromonas sobria]